MIVTVTTNTTLDRTLFVPNFGLNRTIRATRTVLSMGGKPTDASFILGELGIPSLALGFAAGLTGQTAEAMLRRRGVTVDFIPVGGETRINTVIVCEDGSGQSTITTSTLEVSPAHIAALRQRYTAALPEATCIVIGGTVPRGFALEHYAEFISKAKVKGVPVIFDASGEALLAGIKGRPDFIKPNREELGTLVGRPIESPEAAYDAAREVQAQYGVSCIVTLDADGALAVLSERAYRIPPLEVEVVSTAGAGDGVLAGMAAALSRGDPPEEGLRLGFAAATAVLLTPGTADCRRADVERFLPQIRLRPYP